MAYPNLLDLPGAPTVAELQAQHIEEFNRQDEAKRRRLENQVVGVGTSGTRSNDDELLGTSIGTLKGQLDIAAKEIR